MANQWTFAPPLAKQLTECGVVAVLVVDDAPDAVPLARALLEGGITAMELTLRTPAALDALDRIHNEVPEMLAGVGTIVTLEQLQQVIDAKASFGVAPGLNRRIVQAARQANFAFAPGIVTPSEIEQSLELGCRLLKFFPAEPSGGLAYLKSMGAPYQHLNLKYIPLGGVNAQNAATYLASPLIAAIGGSWIASRDLIRKRAWSVIANNARKAMELVNQARS